MPPPTRTQNGAGMGLGRLGAPSALGPWRTPRPLGGTAARGNGPRSEISRTAHQELARVAAGTPARARAFAAGTVNLKVVPSRLLDAIQIRPPNDRSTTSRAR